MNINDDGVEMDKTFSDRISAENRERRVKPKSQSFIINFIYLHQDTEMLRRRVENYIP